TLGVRGPGRHRAADETPPGRSPPRHHGGPRRRDDRCAAQPVALAGRGGSTARTRGGLAAPAGTGRGGSARRAAAGARRGAYGGPCRKPRRGIGRGCERRRVGRGRDRSGRSRRALSASPVLWWAWMIPLHRLLSGAPRRRPAPTSSTSTWPWSVPATWAGPSYAPSSPPG